MKLDLKTRTHCQHRTHCLHYSPPSLQKKNINSPIIIRTPNPSWSPPLPSPPPPSRFLHQLQTSITRSFIKLECFLRPFLKTRSHDESAHTFKSSLQFLEVPQKVFFFFFFAFFAFFYHIF